MIFIHPSWKVDGPFPHRRKIAQDAIADLYHAVSSIPGMASVMDTLAGIHSRIGNDYKFTSITESQLTMAVERMNRILKEIEEHNERE